LYKSPFLLTGILLSGGFLILTHVFDFDLVEYVFALLKQLEAYEVDELVIAALIMMFFVQLELLRKRQASLVENEKLKIYQAMLFGIHHILNNFLNQMQLFKMTAEMSPAFDREILALYDQVIEETTTQIDAIGNVAQIDEEAIRDVVLPR